MEPQRPCPTQVYRPLVLVLACVLLLSAQPASGAPRTAPDFTLGQCLYADTLRLSDFRAYPVLLFFFDAGDMAGSGAYPYVTDWHMKYAADSVFVIGIHSPWFEPLKRWGNAATAVARSNVKFPVGMDLDRNVYMKYQLERLPAFVLIRPGGDIVFETSDPAQYRAVEEMIRWIIRDIEPEAILPPPFEPKTERHPPDAKILPPTPRIILGSSSGAIDNLDSSSLGKYKMYTDSRGRERGRVYLHGRWKVDRDAIAYEEGEESYVRVVYSGKDVWVLPGFQPESAVRVYVKQDRSYLKTDLRTNDIRADWMGRPYIYMRHAVPMHVVSNPRYGTHEIQLIPVEGDVTFHYIFFEGGAAE